MKLLASDLANAIGGRLVGPDTEIDGATFDSRQVLRHQLFVPIVAERDGHDFIGDALKAGAGAYLTSRPEIVEGLGGTAIVVDDTAQALIAVSELAAQRDVVAQAIVNYEQMMVIRRLAGYKELEGTR